ncbi:MAG TPA: hypothetical protein VFE74_03485, partial [Ramlibacter sp.]|nr:hypothetical protein [Ramlibacter sp.]
CVLARREEADRRQRTLAERALAERGVAERARREQERREQEVWLRQQQPAPGYQPYPPLRPPPMGVPARRVS